MFPSIEKLAHEVRERWARHEFADDAFCQIAAEALDQPLDMDFDTLAKHLFNGADLPEQRRLDQGFGQPAITLYNGERFIIEALCWHSGTPAIHQHAFNGAFRLVTGRSVHSRYSFTEEKQIEAVTFGRLQLINFELLDGSSAIEIPCGDGLIHAVFHLDSPCMTIIVRTHQSSEPEPTYLPPGIAYDSSARSPTLHKRLQLLDTLNQTGHEAYAACVFAALETGDLHDCLEIIIRVGGHQIDDATYLGFANKLRIRYGDEIDQLILGLIEERRRSTLVRLRATVTDQNARFFLASLLSFTSRSDILNAMEGVYGDRASARAQISNGLAILLGGDSDRQEVVATTAESILDGISISSFPEYAAHLWGRPLTGDEAETLKQFYRQLREHPLLQPLWLEADD